MPTTASLSTESSHITAWPELNTLPLDHAQFVLDVCDRCRRDDIQRAAYGLLLAQLCVRMMLNDSEARADLVTQLISLRNEGHLSELDAAILINRAKHLALHGASEGCLQGPVLG
jgi:hypothetical protein